MPSKPLRSRVPAKRSAVLQRPSREEAEEAVRTLLCWAGDDPAREGLLGEGSPGGVFVVHRFERYEFAEADVARPNRARAVRCSSVQPPLRSRPLTRLRCPEGVTVNKRYPNPVELHAASPVEHRWRPGACRPALTG